LLPFNFNHLYYFFAVAKAGSFSGAADELRVSQSSISVQVKQFEDSLGHRLFDRVKSGVELTEAGEIVFQYAESVFSDVDTVLGQLKDVEHRFHGTIAIGTVNSIGVYMLPERIKAFNEVYPQVKINVTFKSTAELIELVKAGRIDFAIVTTNRHYAGLASEPLEKHKMFVVAPPGHALTSLDTVSPAELERYPMLGFEEGMETRAVMDALFKRMAISVEYAMESSNVATLKHMVMAGLGISILPDPVVSPEIRRGLLARVDIPSLYMTQDVTAYYRASRGLTPARRQFLRALRAGAARRLSRAHGYHSGQPRRGRASRRRLSRLSRDGAGRNGCIRRCGQRARPGAPVRGNRRRGVTTAPSRSRGTAT
jgi:DNA-binding transcriptional LysR family regulator